MSRKRPARSTSPAATRCSSSSSFTSTSSRLLPTDVGLTRHRNFQRRNRLKPNCFFSRCDQTIARELVGAFVHGMPGMALDPVPAHVIGLKGFVEPFPQIDILPRLLVG